ncbi:hypothetical protein OAA26_00045 [bacterium]|nr:hypothetical protein [bacterium]
MAHTNFVDKDRRFINLRQPQVENVLPEHYRTLYPKFISLLEKYYEFQDENDSTELLNHLFASRDINESDITLLSYIEDELLLGETYFQGFGNNDTELRAAANFSNILFRSKGSKFAIEWFFRSFFGQDVDVIYTKENIFNVDEQDSQLGSNSLKYLTDDKLYQTFAILIRVGIPISRWKEAFKLFAHPAGMYLAGEFFAVDDVLIETELEEFLNQYNNRAYSVTITEPADDIDEGGEFGFTVNVTNIPSGDSALYWYGVHGTTTDADFGVNFDNGSIGLPDRDNKQIFDLTYQPQILASSGNFGVQTIIDTTGTDAGPETFTIYIEDLSGRIVETRQITINDITPSWTITPVGTLNEGTEIVLNISGTNLPFGGETTLKWYLDTSSSTVNNALDFTAPLPIITGPEDVEITGGAGSISFTPVIDVDSDDGETAVIIFLNDNDVQVASQTITINQAAAVIDIVVNSGSDVVEGSSFSTNVQIGAYAEGFTLNYTVTGALGSDPRVTSTSGTLTYGHNGGAGTFIPIQTTSSDDYNGSVAGNIQIELVFPSGGNATDSQSFNLIDGPEEYEMVVTPSFAGQGSTITYTINTKNVQDTTNVFLDIDYGTASLADFNGTVPGEDGNGRQSVTINSNTGSTTLTYSALVTDDRSYQAKYFSALTGGTELASEDLTIVGSNNQSAITPDDTTPDEGQTVDFAVIGKTGVGNVTSDGTYKFWINPNTSFSADDIQSIRINGTSAGSIALTSSNKYDIVVANGEADLQITIKNDQARLISGTESFSVSLGSPDINNPAIANSGTITVQDTSVQTYTVDNYNTFVAPFTAVPIVNENQDLYIGITGTGNGTENLYIKLTGTGASHYNVPSGEYFQGSFTSTPSGSTIVTQISPTTGDDGIVQGPRPVIITVRIGSHSGTVVATKMISLDDSNTDPTGILTAFASGANRTSGTPTITSLDEGNEIFFAASVTNLSDTTTVRYQPDSVIYSAISYNSSSAVVTMPYNVQSENDIQVGMELRGNTNLNGLTVSSISGTQLVLSANPSGTNTNGRVYFAETTLWNQFGQTVGGVEHGVGTFDITSNAGTFDVPTQELTSSLIDESYDWNLYLHDETVWPAVPFSTTKTITLNNISVGINPAFDTGSSSFNRTSVLGAETTNFSHEGIFRFSTATTGPTAYQIFFAIRSFEGNTQIANVTTILGTWIDSADLGAEPDILDYEFRAEGDEQDLEPLADFIGSWNTDVDMSSGNLSNGGLEFGVRLFRIGDQFLNPITLKIKRKNTTNSVTKSASIFLTSFDASIGGGQ